MMNNRSQVQLLESVSVTIIIVILVVIGIAFWSKLNQGEDNSLGRDALSVIELAKTVSEQPELRCFQTAEYKDVNCFDYYKILALNYSMNDPTSPDRQETFDFYNNYFKNSRITFQILYPDDVKDSIVIYDNNISARKSLLISLPVVIEKKLGSQGIRMFGYILVEGYFR